jgi:hypothetical protein
VSAAKGHSLRKTTLSKLITIVAESNSAIANKVDTGPVPVPGQTDKHVSCEQFTKHNPI